MFPEVNVKLLEPTILYLDERPPKNLKNKQRASKNVQRPPKKLTRKKCITKPKKSKARKSTVKKESTTAMTPEIENNSLGEDPLYTPDKEIKMEICAAENKECDFQTSDGENKFTDSVQDKDDVSHDDEYEHETKIEMEEEWELEDENNDDDDNDYIDSTEELIDEDEEPLMVLRRNRGRPRKYPNKSRDHKKKRPRMEKCGHVCKQKCDQKFTPEQRQSICSLFWSLSEEERVQYIRNHIRTRVIRFKHKNKPTTREHCNCYYLDDGNSDSSKLLRVCHKYFQNTLCLSNRIVKNALEGFELDVEIEVKSLIDQRKEYDQKKSLEHSKTEVQQLLDPETGNLVTIDPKAKKTMSEKSTSATATKKKRIRRKPGDPLPEHHPKLIKCAEQCIFKCHTKFTEEERKKICDIFWSMEYNRRKDFILARIQTRDIQVETAQEFRKTNRAPRSYQTRFYLGSGINCENSRVCKKFFMATLAVNRWFIANAIDFADKNTGCYTGSDRRGRHSAVNKISDDRKKIITEHIASYPTWIPKAKSKTRYLHHTLSIKRMYTEYKEMVLSKEEKPVSSFIYYDSFHKEFSLYFLKNPKPQTGKGFLNHNQNISHYTGDEPGGMWLDPQGEKLDVKIHHPAHSFMRCYSQSKSPPEGNPLDLPPTSSAELITTTTAAGPPNLVQSSSLNLSQQLSYAHLIDPILNSSFICPPQVTRQQESNSNLYDNNLQQPNLTGTSTMFRRF